MKLSPLQIARYQYNPKLPGMLRNGISEICVKNARVAYPLSLETKFSFDSSSLTVDFTEDFQARIFELDITQD